MKAGVRIALGTDAGVFEHGRNGQAFALMVQAGMSPAASLLAGTARACGRRNGTDAAATTNMNGPALWTALVLAAFCAACTAREHALLNRSKAPQ